MNKNHKEKLKYILIHPRSLFTTIVQHTAPVWSDAFFLKTVFKERMGYPLDLNTPRTYSEKLQWLKLYNRRQEYIQMVDKVEAKKFVSDIIGEKYVIPTIAVFDRVEDIDFNSLPNQFVLKCTHDSGGIVVCKDKSKLDKNAALDKLARGLKENYYYHNREWPYKNVKPRIIAEQYMSDKNGVLNDYKWFCFDGIPRAMFIATDRFNKQEETKFDFYDMDFRHLPFTNGHPNSSKPLSKPGCFEEMKYLAEKLSHGMPHVRVDLYDVDGDVYFGEMTFFHWSGLMPFEPIEWDYKFGEWIDLSKVEIQ